MKAEIDIQDIQGWLQYAGEHMKSDPDAVNTVIDEYVANSQAMYTDDFAFYAVYVDS